jgi:hypothetical protein
MACWRSSAVSDAPSQLGSLPACHLSPAASWRAVAARQPHGVPSQFGAPPQLCMPPQPDSLTAFHRSSAALRRTIAARRCHSVSSQLSSSLPSCHRSSACHRSSGDRARQRAGGGRGAARAGSAIAAPHGQHSERHSTRHSERRGRGGRSGQRGRRQHSGTTTRSKLASQSHVQSRRARNAPGHHR